MTSALVQDTDSGQRPRALDLLGELVRNPVLREQWLADRLPNMRKLFDRALMLLGGLTHESEWETDILLAEIGCHKRSSAQLDNLTEPELHDCIAYLQWIESLGREAPSSTDLTRALISAASALYGDSRQDLPVCRRAMQQPFGPADGETPENLIRLGEIGLAFQAAQRFLPTRAGVEAIASAQDNPFPLAHIAPNTLDAWLLYDPDGGHDRLAIEQRVRIDQHIEGCKPCGRAAEQRRQALGLSRRPPPILVAPADLLRGGA